MNCATIAAIYLEGLLAIGAQTAPRQWANAQEYDLPSRALPEPDASRQIVLLRDWAARFPRSQFEQLRLVSFALAFQRTGEPNEDDPGVLLLVSALGPALPDPSASEKAVVSAAARKLLSIPMNAPPTAAEQTQPPSTSPAPETQRVIAFVRQLRASRNRTAAKHQELLERHVAEAALRWAGEK